MATSDTFDHGAAQITFKVSKLRTGYMPFGIAATAIVRVFKGETAIQNNQTGQLLAFAQGLGADQLRDGHRELL